MIQLLQLRWSSCFSSGDPAASVDPGDPMRDAVDLFYLAVYVDTSLSCWSSLDHVDTADSLLLQFRRSSCFRYFRSGDPAASDISDQVIQRLQIFQIRWSSCFRCFSSGDPAASDISDQVIQLLQIFQIRWSSCFSWSSILGKLPVLASSSAMTLLSSANNYSVEIIQSSAFL